MENKKEQIIEILENLDDSEKMSIYRDFVNETGYDNIFDMDELDEILSGEEPSLIANMIFYGDFRPNDNYFMFDGCGNLESFDYLDDKMYFDEMAQYMIDYDEDFDNDEIREILDEE